MILERVEFNKFKCDWYACTFTTPEGFPIPDVVEVQHDYVNLIYKFFQLVLSEDVKISYVDKGFYGYSLQAFIYYEDKGGLHRIATIGYMGATAGMGVHLSVTGSTADLIREQLMALGAVGGHVDYSKLYYHTVSRMDIALDILMDSDDSIDSLYRSLKTHCLRSKFKTRYAGDWDYKKDGRTYYIGSSQSNWQMRIYEKGKEQIKKKNIDFSNVATRWVRVELTLKGNRGIKHLLRDAPLRIAANMTKNTSKIYEKFFSQYVELSPVQLVTFSKKETTVDFKMRNLLKQYKNTFLQFYAWSGGSFSSFTENFLRFADDIIFTRQNGEPDLSVFDKSLLRGVPVV